MKAPRLALPPGSGAPSARAKALAPEVAAVLAEAHATAMLLHGVDRPTTELVRLRCASYHNCAT